MTTYRVEWAIDIEAGSPVEAAQKARAIQLDPGSIATVFDVLEYDSKDDAARIDLLGIEPAAGERWSWDDVEEASKEVGQ